jgi:hypothetical protein
MQSLFDWIGNSSLGVFMSENAWAFPTTESIHVLAISIVIGVIAVVDLRLVGLASKSYRVTRLSGTLLPITWVAFVFAVITGLLLFSSKPAMYFENTYFRVKMIAMALAGINMLVFHFLTWRGVASWDASDRMPPAARAAGAISIFLWIVVVICGRWIGFTMDPF